MDMFNHTNYDWYLAVQKKLTARKTRGGENFLSWIDEKGLAEVYKLIHAYCSSVKTIVCHGCRSGLEVDVLQKLNPGVTVYGTDIYGQAYKYDRTYFREMDFDIVPLEWIDYFDVVYSNSIDHSRNPVNTLLSWKIELRQNGICFVNFHWGRGVSREDCFHLDMNNWKDEISEISSQVEMKISHISAPYSFADGASCADVILEKP